MAQHVLSLQIILCLSYLTNALLSVLLASSGLKFKGAWWWVLAQSLMALGTLSDALAQFLPAWLPLIFGNSAYAMASIFYMHAVWNFRFKKPFFYWLYGITAIQIGSFVLAYYQAYVIRAAVFSAWMSIGPLCTAALLLWKVERRFRLANILTALPFLVLGLASVSRLFVLRAVSVQGELQTVSEQNVWYTAGAILLSTIMLFGYFMMSSIQSLQILSKKDEEIQARNQELTIASKNKDLFFAIIAHDIRGPISGAARYVRKNLFGKLSGLEDKYNEVKTLASSLERTNEYLEKLLWWSRAQLQDWSPSTKDIDLAPSLDHAIEMLKMRSDMKDITFRIKGAQALQIHADPECIQLILSNLLGNALKYSHPGREIMITIQPEDAYCKLCIQDQGIGMNKAILDRLFHIEDKISMLGTRKESGNGLGLILAKSLAERNDCSIRLDSKDGIGTKAWLTIPLAKRKE